VAETRGEGGLGEHAKKLVFGSTKSMTGHQLGAAGAWIRRLRAGLERGVIPPTINYKTPIPSATWIAREQGGHAQRRGGDDQLVRLRAATTSA